MTVLSSIKTGNSVANHFLNLTWSDRGLTVFQLSTGKVLFQNARCRVSLYGGEAIDFFATTQLKVSSRAREIVFHGLAGPLEVRLTCSLNGEDLQVGMEVTNAGEEPLQLGDITPLYFEKKRGSITHFLTDPCDAFSLGAATGETGEVWSKEPGNKRVFALRLNAAEPHYVTDNILALRPVQSGSLTPEITCSFDRIADVAAGFSIDLQQGIAFARAAYRGATLLSGEVRALPVLTMAGLASVHDALEAATDRIGEIYRPRPPQEVTTGWCSWYYYYSEVTESNILDNLRFIAAHRERFPCEYIQIDDGYQLHWGDWLLPGTKFQHDMAWLAREIKALGFKPGIWVAPLIMTVQSNLYRDHPDWSLKHFQGGGEQTMKGWSPAEENPWVILDGTHPEFLAHIKRVFSVMAHEWGYDYFKLDATAFGAYAGLRHDPSKTGVEAVRMVMEAIREAVGPDKYILGCGLPFGAAIGLVDGQRVSDDVSTVFREGEGYCPIAVSMPQSIHRSFVHRKWWHNDPDCVLVRSQGTPHNESLREKGMTLEEARLFVTVVGLTQGVQMVGENMLALEEERLFLLDAIQPLMPLPARPMDLFSPHPERLLSILPEGRVLGLLNWGAEEKEFAWDLSERGGDESVPVNIYELWTGNPLSEAAGKIAVPSQAARVLLFRPRKAHPSFLGFDGHVSCGASLLRDEVWDEAGQTLSFEFSANRDGKITVAVPEGWVPVDGNLLRGTGETWTLAIRGGRQFLKWNFRRDRESAEEKDPADVEIRSEGMGAAVPEN